MTTDSSGRRPAPDDRAGGRPYASAAARNRNLVFTSDASSGGQRTDWVRRWAAPVTIGGAVAASAVGALFWVAPRVPVPSAAPRSAQVPSDASAVAAATADLARLKQAVGVEDSQISQLASLPVPQVSAAGSSTVSLPPLAAVPSIGSMSIPAGPAPAFHATTGASGVP